jgi:hypothetical protein
MIEGRLLARFGGRHEDERLHVPWTAKQDDPCYLRQHSSDDKIAYATVQVTGPCQNAFAHETPLGQLFSGS